MIYIPCDIEADNLLLYVTKIHCLSMNWGGEIKTTFSYDDMRKLVARKDITLVGHNFVCYDVPVLERLLGVKVECGVIDTLALSWYLYPSRSSHGLAGWGEEFGVPKPEIDDWKNLTPQQYQHRCEEDVKIQTLLWEKMQQDLTDLYDNNEALISSLMRYLSLKMYTVRLQEQNPFTLDVMTTEKNLAYLEGLKEDKTDALKRVMPTVGVVSKRVPPKTPHKKDGGLSAQGEKWKKLTEERGLVFEHSEPIEVINNYDEPNPNSPAQIKDWLFSIGWKPENFNEGVNGKIPTYYLADKSLCPSVLKLGDDVKSLDELGVLKHRIGLLKGFLRDQEGGYIKQSIAGFTSTLRLRHRFIVNLAKPSMPYGGLIRGVLTCDERYEICGSDLASLEDRTKQHYIYPYDPEYVESMIVEGFDPHLDLAVFAGALTSEQAQAHKDKTEDYSKIRHQYKTVNYAATYGIGAKKLAGTLEIKQSEAKAIIDAYWKRNWSIKSFAKSCKTKQALGLTWIQNPINKFWYELRSEKDAFSAVNQSTGSYIFDMWLGYIFNEVDKITLQSHDEGGWIIRKGKRKAFEKILKDSIEKVNKKLSLNRDMDIDIQWGENYACVH